MTRHVIRKGLPLYQNRLWSNLTAGRPVRVGPYAQGPLAVYILYPVNVVSIYRLAAIL